MIFVLDSYLSNGAFIHTHGLAVIKMGFVFGFISVFLMAAVPVMNKFVVLSISPILGALLNSAFAAIFFSFIDKVRSAQIDKRICHYSMVAGLLNAIGLLCLYLALTKIHPATIGLINRTGIVFAISLSFFILQIKPSKSEIILGAVAVLGALGASGIDLIGSQISHLLFAVISTLSFTASQFYLKLATDTRSNASILKLMNFWSTLLLFLIFIFSTEQIHLPTAPLSWALIMIASLVGSCLGFWLYLISLRELSLAMATIMRATGPMFTALISFPFFGFSFTGIQIGSALILIASIIGISLLPQRQTSQLR